MTATGQDFTIYAGDAFTPVFTVYADDAETIPFDLATAREIVWRVQRDGNSAPVLTKRLSAHEITLINVSPASGEFQVSGLASDSQGLTGYYLHVAVVTDAVGNPKTVTLGRLRVGLQPVWSYSGDPATSPRDAVRNYIGDVDPAATQLNDPEIDYILKQLPNPLLAAAQCARLLASRYSRRVNRRVGDLSINYSDVAKQYYTLAEELQSRADISAAAPYAAGVSVADNQTVDENSDRPIPPFRNAQFDNPSGTNNTTEPGWEPPLP